MALSVALILTATSNQRLQVQAQSQQQYLSTGLLGQQGRQIGVNVIQDMTALSETNSRIRDILTHYGYPVPEAKMAVVKSAMPTPANPSEKAVKESLKP